MISPEYSIASGIVVRDITLTVPLNWHDQDDDRTIEVFARELVDGAKRHDDLPLLVYLQGGPGGKSPRPLGRGSFIGEALERFRVVLPDQRGTGRSTPVTQDTLRGMDAEQAAEHLALHRADSIVLDLEELRRTVYSGQQWWSLGQSYGGFLTLHYLSVAPEALIACAITGGLPALDPDPDEVYARTVPRTAEKNRRFQQQFPQDVETVSRIADLLDAQEILLPDGDRLTVRRLQMLGFSFGMQPGFERTHWLLDEAWADTAKTRLSDTFLHAVWQLTSSADMPLYIALQEAIYGPGPSRWSAHRAIEAWPEFSPSARPLLFTGEMAFPWMFEEIRALRGFREGVQRLAETERPIPLYDLERLAANTVPVEAAVYFDDMYVDAGLSLDTANRVGALHAWVTNEFEHDGIHSGKVAGRLFDALAARVPRST